MAIYHLNLKRISRGKGQNSVAAAAYRSGEKLKDERTNQTKFYPRDVQPETMILSPSHAPEWLQDRERLWNKVEKTEKRYDSLLSLEMDIALPKELSHEQQKQLAYDFVMKECVEKHHIVADLAIHRDDLNNPHFHVMLTTRAIEENGDFGKKLRDLDRKPQLNEWREAWAKHANLALERAGFKERITHLSYEDQGLDIASTIHLGHVAHQMEKEAKEKAKEKGIPYVPVSDRGRVNYEITQLNKEIAETKKELKQLEQQLRRLETSPIAKLEVHPPREYTPEQQEALTFVEKRMKQDVTLPVAWKCRMSVLNWEKKLQKERGELTSTRDRLTQAFKHYEAYKKADPGTIEKERAAIHLGRLDFKPENFEEVYRTLAREYKQQVESFKAKAGQFTEAKTKTEHAVNALHERAYQEATTIYGEGKAQALREFSSMELYKLVEACKTHDKIPPIELFNQQFEKIALNQLQKQYPNEPWTSKIDAQTARNIYEINSREHRILKPDELKHMKGTDQIVDQVASTLKGLLDNDKQQHNQIDKEHERRKRELQQQRRRSKGLER
jgi:hypothetical protein